MILEQNTAVLVASVICFQKIFGLHGLNHHIIEYWVSRGRYWLVLGGTGSEQGGTGCQCDAFRKYMVYMVKTIKLFNILRKGSSKKSLA